ncbi:hypothetical protein Q361_11121 [Flavobacterium croceum DSM 17960]|uniref:DUF6265 domain-containing protein n=1 Tax=Flavobacterium croceum DSM 17960 TaxID=1121886 RepID=A0A2S4N6K5_9FLAO|nr:hypothetical protein Q361_11121 [Flavobacterium croceum DSM 17960]
MKYFYIVILFCFLSCKNETVSPNLIGKKSLVEKANWFLGSWENKSDMGDFYEKWQRVNDSLYQAESFILVKKDTVFYEQVRLKQKKDSLYMIVSVRNQNKEKPVVFYLTQNSENQLTFENPKHDFPTKIVYKKATTDSIVASIEGKQNGKKVQEYFPMKKSK